MTWLIFVIVIVALAAVAFLSFRGRGVRSDSGASSDSAINPSFMPDLENDKLILVKGWDQSEIEQIIRDFIATYQNDGYPAYTIEPHQQSEHLYQLTFPQDIHPTLFVFLVNYLAYPFDLGLTNRSVTVAGKTTLNSGFEEIDSLLVGKKAILYIPEQDEERNVVYMRTESGVTLANSFTEMKWRRVDDARLPDDVKNLIEAS